MEKIKESESLRLQILASGMHLSPEFGMTIQEIRDDGFDPDETVEVLLSGDTPSSICKAMGLGLIGYGDALQRLKPDILVLLGDRFETFCMAAAAQICSVPVAHIHGGEITEGAIDDAFRHCITKMSHLHFASCEAYGQRIIQLGESVDRVFNVGALGVENIKKTKLMSREKLSESIGFILDGPFFLVTFHPVTLEMATAELHFQALLDALEYFPEHKVIITKTNADIGGRVINRMLEQYSEKQQGRVIGIASLGMVRYLSAMRYAAAVIGNSSSGIIEAPTFKVPTINIGQRQRGRVQASSTLDCPPEVDAIRQTIARVLSPAFHESLAAISNPYDRPGTCSTIVGLLTDVPVESLSKKAFFDLRQP
jgi:UDP-hydrolysing UDP-N-acetyl-D-glucosamine 2-epimerase